MRKLLWCGGAGMLAVAVCVFASAKCAGCGQDSLVAQCGKLAWRVCTDWNPAVQLGRRVGSSTVSFLQPTQTERTCAGVACARPADPGPAGAPPAVIEVIDLSGVQMATTSLFAQDLIPVEARTSEPITVLPGAIEEAEVPAEMPPADDDEIQEATPSALDRWLSVAEEGYELLPLPKVDEMETLPLPTLIEEEQVEEAAPEESEETPDGANADKVMPEPDYHRSHPECPYGGGCPGMYKAK